ncbi:MAG: hypothetical protein U0163_14490 [Gemmatimonadaceae bacterium]
MAPQIPLNNFLSDIPAAGIASDRVDPEWLAEPRRWNATFIRNYMVLFGLVSSLDFLTFGVLLYVYRAAPSEFRTGWFIESLLTGAGHRARGANTATEHPQSAESLPALDHHPAGGGDVRCAVLAGCLGVRVCAAPLSLLGILAEADRALRRRRTRQVLLLQHAGGSSVPRIARWSALAPVPVVPDGIQRV